MIEISSRAKSMIDQMITENDISSLFLRVGIEDGGCSGLSYNMKLDDAMTEHDRFIHNQDFKVVWDQRIEQYLKGMKIDYQHQGMTGGFTIDNPNAKATCGCGASFRTANYKGSKKKCD
ncbi:iron-sulfur cluster assembly accessory protein [Paenibacillus sp. J5C_2022]|uniref:HesB/IscA family protein n=1 Tax=Paenibacillus sp. J5C2022 TaxID=2977129 RepID=UPI0021CF142E|nr:iron-sulfur cluster assembly accessory protein [Paenibacillus sp. J5C2022]MCU6712866.1 iron-sulfur cluster assembly accessory protein [Paenibacillus sp. J5C2022]